MSRRTQRQQPFTATFLTSRTASWGWEKLSGGASVVEAKEVTTHCSFNDVWVAADLLPVKRQGWFIFSFTATPNKWRDMAWIKLKFCKLTHFKIVMLKHGFISATWPTSLSANFFPCLCLNHYLYIFMFASEIKWVPKIEIKKRNKKCIHHV